MRIAFTVLACTVPKVLRLGTLRSACWACLLEPPELPTNLTLLLAAHCAQELMYSMDETFVYFAPMGNATTREEQGSNDVKASAQPLTPNPLPLTHVNRPGC